MNKAQTISKKCTILFVAVFQLIALTSLSFSPIILASETPAPGSEASVTPAPCPESSGNTKPSGSAANTYTYNPATCLWENAYYTWDPVTKASTALYDQTPHMNAAGTAWEYIEWYYSPPAGTYKQRVISTPIAASTSSTGTSGNSNLPNASSGSSSPGNGSGSQYGGGSTVSNTGPNSNNTVNNNTDVNGNINYANNTNVFTSLNSNALSGDANVLQNTSVGNVSTGDASAVANYLNMIQSTWNPANGSLSTFNAGLYGNFNGDLLFNPDTIMSTGVGSNNTVNNTTNQNLTINASDNANIQNDITLNAVSGNANVSKNTNAGNVTTGDATAVANIINLINSNINSGSGFIGNLNIYGDLTGDILLPASILSQLRNTGYQSNNSINNSNTTDVDANVNRNSSITNNLDLNAQSGNADVSKNTNAGNVTTGSANTSALQKNLVGGNASGSKGLLVFVNVLGSWVGMMFDAPGQNSNISDTGAYSNNSINNTNNTDVNANLDQNYSITNNIDVNARSGDATVTKNTTVGDTTTGNASAGVNLLNVIDGDYDFSDWFGVLFINVFGTWNGSFGTNTSAGNSGGSGGSNPSSPTVQNNSSTGVSNSTPGQAVSSVKSTVSNFSNGVRSIVESSSSDSADQATSSATTNTSGDTKGAVAKTSTLATGAGENNSKLSIWIPIGAAILAGLALGSKQILAFSRGLLNRS